jgi:hypothetical protein
MFTNIELFEIFVTFLEPSVIFVITQIRLTNLDSRTTQRTQGNAMHQSHSLSY